MWAESCAILCDQVRVHVYIDDELVSELDEKVGERGRSAYIEEAVRARMDRERRGDALLRGIGTIGDEGHPWDPDPAAYFTDSRRAETERRSR